MIEWPKRTSYPNPKKAIKENGIEKRGFSSFLASWNRNPWPLGRKVNRLP